MGDTQHIMIGHREKEDLTHNYCSHSANGKLSKGETHSLSTSMHMVQKLEAN